MPPTDHDQPVTEGTWNAPPGGGGGTRRKLSTVAFNVFLGLLVLAFVVAVASIVIDFLLTLG